MTVGETNSKTAGLHRRVRPDAQRPGFHGDATPIQRGSIALVICDWNGTVVDDGDRACAATNAVLSALQLPNLDLATFFQLFSLPLDRFLMNLGVADDQTPAAVEAWNRELATRPARLAPGATELFRTAQTLGIPVGVMSAASVDVVAADAAALDVSHYFAFVIGAVTSKSARLRPLVHQTQGAVLYVGDTEYDVREALTAGALSVGVGNGYRPPAALLAAGAMCVVDDLSVLASMLAAGSSPSGPPFISSAKTLG